jgi:hypothetical protein
MAKQLSRGLRVNENPYHEFSVDMAKHFSAADLKRLHYFVFGPGRLYEQFNKETYEAAAMGFGALSSLSWDVTGASATVSSLTPAPRGAVVSTTPSVAVVATNTVDDILPTPVVSNTKLQNIVNDLYKGTTNPGRVGTGTTADAVRNELVTGLATGGKFHSEKAQIYINGLNKVLKQDLTASDRLVAQSLLDDLTNALGGVP